MASDKKNGPLQVGEREFYNELRVTYPGRISLALHEFVRDFLPGRGGRPMQRKTAQNRVYNGTFPLPVVEGHVFLIDIAVWLYRQRTKHAQRVDFFG